MKILAVGYNYHAHREEQVHSCEVLADQTEPLIFHKGDSVLRRGMPFFLPDFGSRIEYEAEIVVQISRVGKCIAERFAHRYYDQITLGIDFTARDLQRRAITHGQPWTLSKAFDNSAAVGDWMDKHELGYPERPIDFSLRVDGETVQQSDSSMMIHSIDRLIAYISQFHTLKMGDLIFTGTPSGVGEVKIGQTLEGYIGGRKVFQIPVK